MIAEIKGASPAAGTIRTGFDPVSVARTYEAGGAAALSVLTDAKYFGGSWDALAAVCRVSPLPVLCKEFIIDPDQIDDAAEAAAAAGVFVRTKLSVGGPETFPGQPPEIRIATPFASAKS